MRAWKRTALVLLLSLLTPTLHAQFQTGNIYGKVTAKDGSGLPGVTITLTGVGAPQTTVSDPTGGFRFLRLSPGTYGLKAELAGYGSVTQTNITVGVAQNADITMTLNPSVAESITVSAETPLLDVRKTGTGINVTKVELQQLPTGRDPWVIMQQTPGVLLDRINVGGNQSGQQSGYDAKGKTSDQSTWTVDGVNITDVGALGSTPTYYDFDSFEEVQITTGGTDPRIMTPGVQMNMVTKRGTNDLRGSGRWFQTNDNFQAKPSIPTEAASYLKRVNQINHIEDRGFELGGPVMKDRIWFWGAVSRQNVNLLTATLLNPADPNSRFLDKTLLMNQNLKLNAQPFASNSLTITDSYGEKVKLGRNVGPTRAPETAWNQANHYRGGTQGNLGNPTIWKVEDTQIIGTSLYLTGLYSQVQGGFQLIADNGEGCQTYGCGLAAPYPAWLNSSGDGSWHGSYLSEVITRPQKQARLDGSKFFDIHTTNHELKFGFGYRHGDVRTDLAWPNLQYTTVDTKAAAKGDTGFAWFMRPYIRDYSVNYTDLYAGDTMMLGNLTVQASLRYDLQRGQTNGNAVTANPVLPDLLPAITYSSVHGLKWTNVAPRIGLTYALGANKQTLLRAAYNRYTDQLGGATVYRATPGAYSYLYYYFNDINGDHIAQHDEIDLKHGVVQFGGVDPNNPSTTTQFYRWDSSLKAPHTDEFIVGGEQQLMPTLSVGATASYRKISNFVWTIGEHHQGQGDFYSPADYVPASTPATATLPNGTTVTLPYYVLAPGLKAPVYFDVTNRPDYYQTYKGLELFASKRMANRWMARAGVTLQDWSQHVGARAIIDPTVQRSSSQGFFGCTVCNGAAVLDGAGSGSGDFGGVYINSKWAYDLNGVYKIPVIETSFGVNLLGRQGYPVPYVYRVIAPGGEGAKLLLTSATTDQYRHPNVTELDMRLAKDLPLYRGAGVTLSVDCFNVLNRQTILQRDVRRLQLASSNRITELQSPRVFRVGARVTF